MVETYTKEEWKQDLHILMAYGTGEQEGEDILTPDIMNMLQPLLPAWRDLNVTDERGVEWTTTDLCMRFGIPDTPYWGQTEAFELPCLVAAPHTCFQEARQGMSAGYLKADDPGPKG